MTRYRIEAQEFEATENNFCDLLIVAGGFISRPAVEALGIVEVEPEPDAYVTRAQTGVGVNGREWLVYSDERGVASAAFVDKDDAVAWAREKFGPNVKVED